MLSWFKAWEWTWCADIPAGRFPDACLYDHLSWVLCFQTHGVPCLRVSHQLLCLLSFLQYPVSIFYIPRTATWLGYEDGRERQGLALEGAYILEQGLANSILQARSIPLQYFCKVQELRTVFIFLKIVFEPKGGYFVAHENYMNFKVPCPVYKWHWSTAACMHSHMFYFFHPH